MVLGGSLVRMMSSVVVLDKARMVFYQPLNRDVVAWTTMIAGYAQQGPLLCARVHSMKLFPILSSTLRVSAPGMCQSVLV